MGFVKNINFVFECVSFKEETAAKQCFKHYIRFFWKGHYLSIAVIGYVDIIFKEASFAHFKSHYLFIYIYFGNRLT